MALAAVRALGPGAAEWAAGLRARYPTASADGLAGWPPGGSSVRRARAGRPRRWPATLRRWPSWPRCCGPTRSWCCTWPRHTARIRRTRPGRRPAGADPGSPGCGERHGSPGCRPGGGRAGRRAWPRAAEAAWRLAAPLTAQAGGWVALRLVARLLPGPRCSRRRWGRGGAERLAARTVAVYRPGPR
ncbi:hypothetical protein NKG94_36955 [Micromonospora sp. M12]